MTGAGLARTHENHFGAVVLKNTNGGAMLAVAVILVACCLRAPITCIGPVADVIQGDLAIDGGAMGSITSIPLVVFGLSSILIGTLGRRHPAGALIGIGLVIVLAGLVCRSFLGTWGIFAGTAVVGLGIAFGNVLLPAVIKTYFPARIGRLTALYTAFMSVMSAVAGAISYPLYESFGWRASLAVWTVLLLVTLMLWIPHRDRHISSPDSGEGMPMLKMLRCSTTWLIACYMGLQSLLFYTFVAWLSVILVSEGLAPDLAGYVTSMYMVMGIVGSLSLPVVAHGSDLRALGVVLGAVYFIGVLALAFSDSIVAVGAFVLCCGYCAGACISLSMLMFGLRTMRGSDSSALSGIAQSVGYLIAAVGPIAIGAVYTATGGWDSPLLILLFLTVVLAGLGYLIGRDRPVY